MGEYREEYIQERMTKKTTCGICGHEITFYQIASDLDGKITDFTAKDIIEISGPLCEECTTKLIHFMRQRGTDD